jgi:hypothetical protein
MLFAKIILLSILYSISAFAAPAESDSQAWFRNEGEYAAYRSTRSGVMTEDNTEVVTDGLRYDAAVGKRIPLFTWGEEGKAEGWSAGIDGGMLASLRRQTVNGSLTFSTNTFDGHFGAFLGYIAEGWLFMFDTGHLSAHLVDGISTYQTPIRYSRFWNELMVGKSLFDPNGTDPVEVYFQGSIGANNTSTPNAHNPLWGLGVDLGAELSGPDSIAILATADASNAGVSGQTTTYSEFLGIGYLSKPNTVHRPFRVGASHFHGSDYRNQLFAQTQNFTAFEVQTTF